MVVSSIVYWDVDTQADFMLPGGKLYVPGAEKLIPNLRRLVDAARQGRVRLVSSADAHTPDDEEFQQWPAHCLRGTPGQKKIPETLTSNPYVVPNQLGITLPAEFSDAAQVIVEKQKLDVFTNPSIETVLGWLGPDREFIVFGVATECCVRCAALGLLERGRRVAVVTDAIQALDAEAGRRTLEELTAKGTRLIDTNEALALLDRSAYRVA